MADEVLTVERRGAVVHATLNRPSKANALSRELLRAIDTFAADIEAQAAAGSAPGAVVLTGAGQRAFCAGADISELEELDYAAARDQMRYGQAIFGRLERLPVAVIAAVNGVALGGGLELAMAADIRVAAPHAGFGQPEIELANLPGWGGTQRLPRLVGRGVALEMILTGSRIDAPRALALGLVNHIDDDVLSCAAALAERIAAHSSTAIAGAKRAVAAGMDFGIAAGLEAEADAVAACCQTDEQHDAVRAFLARKAGRG